MNYLILPRSFQDRLPWLIALNQILQKWDCLGGEIGGPKDNLSGGGTDTKSGLGVGCHGNGAGGVAKGVMACSALKREYRKILRSGVVGQSSEVNCMFVVLNGSLEVIGERMRGRGQHFMPPGLLRSQLDTLELPTAAEGSRIVTISDITLPVEGIVEEILTQLSCGH